MSPLASQLFAGQGEMARVTFFVKDNGAGFDPAYAAKLFAPFQRVKPAHVTPSAG